MAYTDIIKEAIFPPTPRIRGDLQSIVPRFVEREAKLKKFFPDMKTISWIGQEHYCIELSKKPSEAIYQLMAKLKFLDVEANIHVLPDSGGNGAAEGLDHQGKKYLLKINRDALVEKLSVPPMTPPAALYSHNPAEWSQFRGTINTEVEDSLKLLHTFIELVDVLAGKRPSLAR